jgi:hypothetical protein
VDTRPGFSLATVLAAVCFAIAAVSGANRAIATTQTPLSQATSCAHPLGNSGVRLWKPTEVELHGILAKHLGWRQKYDYAIISLQAGDEYLDHVKPPYPDWRRVARRQPELANLCNADLSGANLSRATLNRASLTGALLTDANLSSANLSFANLSGAILARANLNSAKLFETHLSGADLSFANLSGASLDLADLSHADLSGADVSKAKLDFVDLTDTIYSPRSEPPNPYVAGIRGLATLHVPSGQPFGVVQLRKLLQDGGFRDGERAATYAIERSRTTEQFASAPMLLRKTSAYFGFIDEIQLSQGERQPRAFSVRGENAGKFAWAGAILRILTFDMTTSYGLRPTRALVMIVVLGGILTPVYTLVMLHPTARSGVVQIFPKDRLDGTAGDPVEEKERKTVVVQARNVWDAFRRAAWFSLLSAVNIGFEKFTPGDWIRRAQSRDYTLEAVGWVRVVSGLQALLSVGLLAMWALTQFGRPFE